MTTVVLTNFWDALYLIKEFIPEAHIYGIAIYPPKEVVFPTKNDKGRLDFFVPSYKILKKYKEDGDWSFYTKEYHNILRANKHDIRAWIDSLDPSVVYVLCCWENTVKGSRCHRKLVYDALNKSEFAKGKIKAIYRHGNKVPFTEGLKKT